MTAEELIRRLSALDPKTAVCQKIEGRLWEVWSLGISTNDKGDIVAVLD